MVLEDPSPHKANFININFMENICDLSRGSRDSSSKLQYAVSISPDFIFSSKSFADLGYSLHCSDLPFI